MKHGKKPTLYQRKQMESLGLNSDNWLVVMDTPEKMVIVHRHSDSTVRTIYKGVRE